MSVDKFNRNDKEINLIDLIFMIHKYRKILLFSIISLMFIFTIGYFIIPRKRFKHQNYDNYIHSSIKLSISPSISEYIVNDNELVYSFSNVGELYMCKSVINLFKDPLFLYNVLISVNNTLLPESKEQSLKVIQDNMIDLDKGGKINTSFSENKWYYVVEADSEVINIDFFSNYLSEKDILTFMNTLYDFSNSVLIKLSRQRALSVFNDYQKILNTNILTDISDSLLIHFKISSRILKGEISPLVKIEGPNIKFSDTKRKLSIFQKNYIKISVGIFFTITFILVFIFLLLDFIKRLKNDNTKSDKYNKALGKK